MNESERDNKSRFLEDALHSMLLSDDLKTVVDKFKLSYDLFNED